MPEPVSDPSIPHVRWNVGMLWIDAIGFFAGLALFDAMTIAPALLIQLGSPAPVAGLVRFIQFIGSSLPALIAAHYIQRRSQHKMVLLTTGMIGRLGIVAIIPTLWYANRMDTGWVIAVILLGLALFWTSDGICGVSWFDLVGKCVPEPFRGRFYGIMQTIAGVFGVLAGLVVYWVLGKDGPGFPQSYAWLALGWLLISGISLLAIGLLREPMGIPPDHASQGIKATLKACPEILKSNRPLSQTIRTRLFSDAYTLAAPFFSVYAIQALHEPASQLGIYLACQNAGRIGCGPILGWLTDRKGARLGLQAMCLLALLGPACAVAAWWNPAFLMVTFVAVGAVQDGLWMSYSNAVMSVVRPSERPMAVGISTVCLTPAALYGLIGSAAVASIGYLGAFSIALGLCGVGLISGLRILPQLDALAKGE